jgi:class 3 adenylate cyclase
VGAAAGAFGGTIKDQAGDGVLMLVGAPVSFEDHARRALEMAKRIRDLGVTITARWSDADLRLGVGVGVASGYVTVGVIGAASRLEYTAVGPAVNLAARLCSEAAHGQVLVDARTNALLDAGAAAARVATGRSVAAEGIPAAGAKLRPVSRLTACSVRPVQNTASWSKFAPEVIPQPVDGRIAGRRGAIKLRT